MGDIADGMLGGELCEGCGMPLDGEPGGYPRWCSLECASERKSDEAYRIDQAASRVPCPICGKTTKPKGLNDHIKAAHPDEQAAGEVQTEAAK